MFNQPELELISFADDQLGIDLQPADMVAAAQQRAVADLRRLSQAEGAGADAAGRAELLRLLCARLASKGITAASQDMLITASYEQAVDLILRTMARPGAAVLVEKPADPVVLRLLQLNRLHAIQVESDRCGMIPEEAERLMRQYQPRLLYVAPSIGNPSGGTWSAERRKAMLKLCQYYELPLVEDDSCGELSFSPRKRELPPAMYTLAPAEVQVIYLGTFARSVSPQLRPGWLLAKGSVFTALSQAQPDALTWQTAVDLQALASLLKERTWEKHKRTIALSCKRRLEGLQTALAEELLHKEITDVKWNSPQGGLFLWLELPEALDASALLRCAARKGVVFAPGTAFYTERPQRNTARLNFTQAVGEQTALGAARLAEAISEFTARR